jgi:preprotein translocase subunit YajC
MELLRTSELAQDTPPAQAPAAGTTETVGQPDGGAPPSAANPFMSFVPLVLIIVVFYFVMIGPERKQRKKREAMLAAVKKGDKVVTTGGMFATVAAVNEDVLTLQAADDVRLRFSRQSIAQVIEDDAAEGSSKP